jgi:predicted ferric reductase
MGKQIIDCGIYCVGSGATTDATNDAAVVSTGLLYFIVGLALTALFLALALLSAFSAEQDNNGGKGIGAAERGDSKPLLPPLRDPAEVKSLGIKHKSAQALRNRAKNAYTVVALALTFGFVYPVFFFSCTALPTWWAYFTKHGIQAYEVSLPPKTYGTFWSLKIGQDLILKLYPDILIYYGAIYLVAGVAVVAQTFPSVYHRLSKKPSRLGGLSVGEFALAVLLVVLLVGQFFYWYFDHGWENEEREKRSSAEIAARSVGQVANMVTGLLVLPVTRNSVWTVLLGVSWENLVAYHQILGYLLLLLVLTHMFLWWSVYAQQGTFPHDIFAVPMKYHKDNFTVPLAVVSTMLMFLVMGGLSLPVVRRLHYDLFYWSHHLSLGLFLMMLWHSTMSWYYIAAGLTLWAADHALRLYHCLGMSVRVERAAVEGDGNIVHLSYTVSRPQSALSLRNPFAKTAYTTLAHSAGQYCYINIPQVSQLAWHPFTISSTPSDSATHHHIKSMGQDQWTERLLLLVRGIESGHGGAEPSLAYLSRRLSVNIDGPYGIPLDPAPYRCALLVAGGIGITPLYATFKQWYESSRGADRLVLLLFFSLCPTPPACLPHFLQTPEKSHNQ